jgi:hypothetical protein
LALILVLGAKLRHLFARPQVQGKVNVFVNLLEERSQIPVRHLPVILLTDVC